MIDSEHVLNLELLYAFQHENTEAFKSFAFTDDELDTIEETATLFEFESISSLSTNTYYLNNLLTLLKNLNINHGKKK